VIAACPPEPWLIATALWGVAMVVLGIVIGFLVASRKCP
jgi:vacuolar-type H+-ATPase subunit I/STV1